MDYLPLRAIYRRHRNQANMTRRLIPFFLTVLSLLFISHIDAQVNFDIGEVSGDQGTTVCVPVTVSNFTGVAGFGFSLIYNPLELQLLPDPNGVNFFFSPALATGSNPAPGGIPIPGILNVSWVFSFFNTLDLNDGDVIFEVCFDVLAPSGTISPVEFNDGSLPNTLVPDVTNNTMTIPLGNLDNGAITVTGATGGLMVNYGACSTLDVPVSNGSLQIQISGGTPPYSATYTEVANPANTGSFTVVGTGGFTPSTLPSGDYTVVVSDAVGGMETSVITIQQTTPLLLPLDRTDPSCAGAMDGTITLNNNLPLGGVPGHTITWSTSAVNTQMISGLAQGPYSVTVVDAAGCVMFGSQAIVDPLIVTIDSINQSNLSCNGPGNDGSITVAGSGGTIGTGSDYSYSWTGPGVFTANTPTITGLVDGQYCVEVTDDNSCLMTRCFDIIQDTGPSITGFTTVGIGCPNDMNGGITVIFTESVNAPSTFIWSNLETTQTISGLGEGTYTVTITDQVGCTDTLSETIVAPNPLMIDMVNLVLPPCSYDTTDGRISVVASGGSGNYSFAWDNGQMNATNIALKCGESYTVTITDGTNCPSVDSTIFLPCPPDIIADFPMSMITSVDCDGGIPCDGQATVVASGGPTGSGSYNFIWENSESTNGAGQSSAIALCQGWNTVTISDLVCAFSDSVFIDAPPPLSIVPSSITNVSCNMGADGSITVMGAGGVGGFSYQWDGGPMSATYSGLTMGNYTVTVTDANQCETFATIDLQEPMPITLAAQFGLTKDPSCNGDMDGIIELGFTGGNPGAASYNWLPNVSTTNIATGVSAGSYDVTVSDSKGCTGVLSYVLNNPPPIDFTLGSIIEPACFGEQAVVTVVDAMGGTGDPFSFSVGSSTRRPINQPIRVLASDNLSVKVFDDNGCFDEQFIDIDQPDEMILEFGATIEEISLGESTILNPFILTQFPLDSVIWSPLSMLSCVDSSNLSASCTAVEVSPFDDTDYTVTLVDINGCEVEASIRVNVDKNRGIYIPNAFSPNNDGNNDFFSMFVGLGVEEITSYQVYSRWGELVSSNSTPISPLQGENQLWDGFFGGKAMNPGVFVYSIDVKFIDGQEFTYRGDITLMR